MRSKLHWVEVAEVIDSLRIFPRLFLAACFTWVVQNTWVLVAWYIHLPHAERGLEATGFGSSVLLGEMAFLRLVYSTYSENGRNWDARTSTTVASSSVTQVTAP